MVQTNSYTGERTETYIKKLFIIETKPYSKDIWYRNYQLNANQGQIDGLRHVINKNKSFGSSRQRLNDYDIMYSMPNIVNLKTDPIKATIENGWKEKRARFLMEVETRMGTVFYRTYLQGYTNYLDNSIYGKLDPNMKLIINSTVIVTSSIDPLNQREHITRQSFYNIVPGEMNGTVSYQELDNYMNVKKLIRPEDVLSSLILTEKHYGTNVSVINVADELNSCKVSSRLNNSMTKYFNRVTSSFIDAKNMAENSDDKIEVLQKARSAAYEDDLTRNPFMRALHEISGTYMTATFTLDDVVKLDPNCRPVYIPRETTPIYDGSLAFVETENTMDTLQPLPETLKANIIANELPAYMCECMLTSVSLSMTNETGDNVAVCTNVQSFVDGLEHAAWIDPLLVRVKALLMPKLSDNNITVFQAHVVADIVGEITISIGLHGCEPLIYRYPCFADSLYSPVVTDAANKDILVNEFQTVFDNTYPDSNPISNLYY